MSLKLLKYPLLAHLIAIILAGSIFLLITPFFKRNTTANITNENLKRELVKGAYANYSSNKNQVAFDIIQNLNDNKAILAFGSSELGHQSEYFTQPYHFITNTTDNNLLAIGHAGQQTMAIYTQLLNYYEYLDNSKIVFILSPGWFSNDCHTSIESFLEYNSENFLIRVKNNKNIKEKYKKHIGEYINLIYSDLNSPSWIIKDYYFSYNKPEKVKFYPSYILNKALLQTRQNKNNKPYPFSTKKNNLSKDLKLDSIVNWSKIKADLKKEHLAISTNNDWGVYNEYYTKYVNGVVNYFTFKPFNENYEYNDFKILVDLLKEKNVDAFFIMQPLNPNAYSNMEGYDPIIDSIENLLNKANYPLYNMFVSKKENYEKGVLKDIMHLGDYGWMQVNEKIIEHYGN